MKKLSKGQNQSLIKDFASGPSLIKYNGRLDTSTGVRSTPLHHYTTTPLHHYTSNSEIDYYNFTLQFYQSPVPVP
jgi:hypothetical protein